MRLTDAAQAVQHSAYPDAYAKHETRAAATVAAALSGQAPTECAPVAVSAAGWTQPVAGPVVSGFRPPDRPGHDGIDLAAARGTVVRAASGGVVVTVLCTINGQSWPPDGRPTPCNLDGDLSVTGCGWYVEIRHAGNIVSRYCHLLRHPGVRARQPVAAGQPIGLVGSSGNSSGLHLHLEIHTGYPATRNNAINPAPFLARHGAPLHVV
jgi:murein DD-endopeptidase MepM/ murein hydrolase activator NlpD